LSPPPAVDIRKVQRDFTIRANDAFVLLYAARLSALVTDAAPGMRLRFAPKPNKEIQPLRCLLYTSPSPRDRTRSRMPSSA
jgi:hypothetical protein